jgi:hypothetical protein
MIRRTLLLACALAPAAIGILEVAMGITDVAIANAIKLAKYNAGAV